MKFVKKIASVALAAAVFSGAAVCDLPNIVNTVSTVQAASELQLDKTSISLGNGESFWLTANKTVSWRTSNSKIITVSNNGNVKAVGIGTAWITARTSDGKEKSCKVAVKNAPSKVSVSKTAISLGIGETYSLSAVLPNGTASAKRVFRTSNSSIVKMTKTNWTGQFKAVKEGTAWVTVKTYNGKEASCKITVKKAPSKVTISKNNLTLGVGETYSLSASLPNGTASAKRTFRTSNSGIVKMTSTDWTGSFKAVKEGTAWVTVKTYNGKQSSCKITVKKAPQSVGLNHSTLNLKVGQKATLSALLPSGTASAKRTFRTSNSSIVKMTKTNWTGEFTAVAKGTAWVTVRTFNGKEKSCKIVVTDNSSSNNGIYSAEMTASFKNALKKEAESNGGKIDLMLWCNANDVKFEKTRVEAFKKLYAGSGYTINVKILAAYGEDTAAAKIIESPKDGADVFNFSDESLGMLVKSRAVAPVADVMKNYIKSGNTADSLSAVTSGGTTYAFPKTCDNGFYMIYDKRVYKNASDLATLDGMIAKANASGKNVYFNLSNSWYNAAFFFTAGVDISYKDGVQTAAFNTNKGLSAAKAMCRVAQNQGKGLIAADGGSGDNIAIQRGFGDGSIAAAVTGSWMLPVIKNEIGANNVGAAKLPTVLMDGKQKQLYSFSGYKCVGVNSFSKYPVASQLLACYLTNGESQLLRYKNRGAIPVSKSALADPAVKNDESVKAIAAQRPYSHGMGTTVSSKYWASSVGYLGGTIVTKKGLVSDSELKKMLKSAEESIS